MSAKQEKIIKNYIYQIRAPFSLQEVHENTGVPKTTAFRILHKLLDNGDIAKTCASASPQKYRAVIRVAKEYSPRRSTGTPLKERGFDHPRQDEVEEKAKELGVSGRTVYRIEKRVASGKIEDPFNSSPEDTSTLYPYMQDLVKKAEIKGSVQVKDVQDVIGCDDFKALEVLKYLAINGYLELAPDSSDIFNLKERRIS